jgi:group I intron endonuclease
MAKYETACVYALLDPETGKPRYVGHSADVSKRVRRGHWRNRNTACARAANPAFADWLCSLSEKPEAHIFETVPYVDRYKAEAYYTDLLRQIPGIELLNINTGARPAPEHVAKMVMASHTPEARAKISATLRGNSNYPPEFPKSRLGKHNSPEHNAAIAAARQGTVRSTETREKISAALRGKPLSTETKAKLSAVMAGENNPHYGKSHTDEAKAKISAAHMGKPLSPEHCAKLGESHRGFKHSPETRARMSAARKAYWASRKAAVLWSTRPASMLMTSWHIPTGNHSCSAWSPKR